MKEFNMSGRSHTKSEQPQRRLKYQADTLLQMFKSAAAFRRQMIEAGFTDNAGAIHSAERVMDLLGLRLNYPELSHRNNLRKHIKAKFSVAALAAYERGESVKIEHVSPLRDMTRQAIDRLERGASDSQLRKFIERNYQLALLTPEEMQQLNRVNSSRMEKGRLAKAGIKKLVLQKVESRTTRSTSKEPAPPREVQKPKRSRGR